MDIRTILCKNVFLKLSREKFNWGFITPTVIRGWYRTGEPSSIARNIIFNTDEIIIEDLDRLNYGLVSGMVSSCQVIKYSIDYQDPECFQKLVDTLISTDCSLNTLTVEDLL